MADTYKKFGGLDWPIEANEHSAYMQIARYYHVPLWIHTNFGVSVTSLKDLGCTLPPNEAMVRAVGILIPDDLYRMNPWSESMITEFTGTADSRYPELVVQASAGASKSETFGLLGLLYFMTNPKQTTVRFVSTDIKGLKQRSFGAVTRFFNHIRKLGPTGCVFSRQTLAVVNADDDDEKVSSIEAKAGVFGFAMKSGTIEDGISKVIGTHWPQPGGGICLVADEAQNVPEAWYAGLANLWVATTDVRLISLGNPTDLTGGLADRAEPEHGWGSVTVDDDRWTTRRGGVCLHFDGEKSPAITDPVKYPFLIKQQDIDRVLADNHGRVESAGYMSMVRGWMPSAEGHDLLIPMSLINKFGAKDPVTWARQPEHTFMGFDPGYGGDAAAVQIIDVGVFANGYYGLSFRDPIELDINPSSSTPVQYQMSSQLLDIRRKCPFPMHHSAFDESGLQRVADVVEAEAGEPGVIRVNFASRASGMPVSYLDPTPAFSKYGNAVTEMWAKLADLIQYGQVRGLPDSVARELAMRVILPKRPLRLESKQELKKRLKRSPDHADAAALAVWAALVSGVIVPGSSVHNPYGAVATLRRSHRPQLTADYMASNYGDAENFA